MQQGELTYLAAINAWGKMVLLDTADGRRMSFVPMEVKPERSRLLGFTNPLNNRSALTLDKLGLQRTEILSSLAVKITAPPCPHWTLYLNHASCSRTGQRCISSKLNRTS